MKRRLFLGLLTLAQSSVLFAHSPWGQYQVYRQKHLLILSSRDDAPSYPYSKKLVEALAVTVPSANARPARAKDLNRVYNLLRTNQFQFAILSKPHISDLRSATGQFAGGEKLDILTIYEFDDLEFVVRADFPEDLVSVVTHGVMEALPTLSGASGIEGVKNNPRLHPGALKVLKAALE